MELEVTGEVVEWRGPAPHHFVPVSHDVADAIADVAPLASYGWGCIPATCTLGEVVWTTSLIPREDTYFVPLKADMRRRTGVGLGDVVTFTLRIDV